MHGSRLPGGAHRRQIGVLEGGPDPDLGEVADDEELLAGFDVLAGVGVALEHRPGARSAPERYSRATQTPASTSKPARSSSSSATFPRFGSGPPSTVVSAAGKAAASIEGPAGVSRTAAVGPGLRNGREQTRTARARIVVANPRGTLRPRHVRHGPIASPDAGAGRRAEGRGPGRRGPHLRLRPSRG